MSVSVLRSGSEEATVDSVAVVAYHSSPLVEPGLGDSGGMTIYVRELAGALARRGVHTDIFTRMTDETPRMSWLSSGVRVIGIEAGPLRALNKDEAIAHMDEFVTGVRAFAASQRIGYDLVHSHYWQSGLAGKTLAGLWDVPLVHSHHTLGRVKNNSLAPGDRPEPQRRIDGEIAVMDAADVLLASTDDEWQQVACLYGVPHDRLKTLHPGVDHSLFRPGDARAARRVLGLADEAVMLYVGRIQPLKGLELAIRSAEELVPALDRPLVFLVVGGGSGPNGHDEMSRLRQITTDLGLDDVVRFVGAQPHTDLPTYYRAADIAVMCSHSESFGLAALEAQACGTPVVSTAVGGLSHVIEEGVSGFLVGTRDPAVFAGRLKTILSDDELKAALGTGAERSASAFSWDATADAMLELYTCLVAERMPEVCVC